MCGFLFSFLYLATQSETVSTSATSQGGGSRVCRPGSDDDDGMPPPFAIILRLAATTSFVSICIWFALGQKLKNKRITENEILQIHNEVCTEQVVTRISSFNVTPGHAPISKTLQVQRDDEIQDGTRPWPRNHISSTKLWMQTISEVFQRGVATLCPHLVHLHRNTSLVQVPLQHEEWVEPTHQDIIDPSQEWARLSQVKYLKEISTIIATLSNDSVKHELKQRNKYETLLDPITWRAFKPDVKIPITGKKPNDEIAHYICPFTPGTKYISSRIEWTKENNGLPPQDHDFACHSAATQVVDIKAHYTSNNPKLTGCKENFKCHISDDDSNTCQGTERHRRTFSPIAEEPEDYDDDIMEASFQSLNSSRSTSSTADSSSTSSDLVFLTNISTSQNPEESSEFDLIDLKEDPEFQSLIFQDEKKEREPWGRNPDKGEINHALSHFEQVTEIKKSMLWMTEVRPPFWWQTPSLPAYEFDDVTKIYDVARWIGKVLVETAVQDAFEALVKSSHRKCLSSYAHQMAGSIVKESLRLSKPYLTKKTLIDKGNEKQAEKKLTCPKISEKSQCILRRSTAWNCCIQHRAGCKVTGCRNVWNVKRSTYWPSCRDEVEKQKRSTTLASSATTRHTSKKARSNSLKWQNQKQRSKETRRWKNAPQPSQTMFKMTRLQKETPQMLSKHTQTDFASSRKNRDTLGVVRRPLVALATTPKKSKRLLRRSMVKEQLKAQLEKSMKAIQPKEEMKCYVTVVLTDEQAIGALVVAHSLRKVNATHWPTTCVLVGKNLNRQSRQLLSEVYDHVHLTSELCSHDDLALSLLGRPDLGVTFTKLHCWRLTQFQKCVFLDADTLVLQNCDELFEWEELSAVPDTGWPDCFNSGVFVFRPSLDTYAKLVNLATSRGSFDGGDQGLLNMYFGTWRSNLSRRLPFVYNVVSSLSYTYAPAYRHYASGVKIVHFAGTQKPWAVRWRTDTGDIEGAAQNIQDLQSPIVKMWIEIFRDTVLPKLPQTVQSLVRCSTTMTVVQILHRINASDVKECESYTVMEGAPCFPCPEFPSHAMVQNTAILTPPPSLVPIRNHDPSPLPQEATTLAKAPISLPSTSNEKHEFSALPQPWHRYEPSYPDSNPETQQATMMTTFEGRSILEEPADPHWEALLWHAVQTPWEPPELPSTADYELPPSQMHREESNLKPTFTWFSEECVTLPQHDEWAEPSRAPFSNEPPSIAHPDTVLNEAASIQITIADHIEEIAQGSKESTDKEVTDPLVENEETSMKRMKSWEEGNVDYLGKDKFENIWKKIELMFTDPEPQYHFDELKDDLHKSIVHSITHNGSLASSSLLDNERISVPGGDLITEEPEDIWPGYPEGDFTGMTDWQEGRIDYCGRDKSDNIMRRLDLIISGGLLHTD